MQTISPILAKMVEFIRIRQILLALLLLCSSLLVLFMEDTSSSSYKDVETKRGITSRLLQKTSSAVVDEASVRVGRYVNGGAGAGSSPPRCISRCANCTPCKPVRVPVKPGTPRLQPSEYYPEAWRCMCHNKLYMP